MSGNTQSQNTQSCATSGHSKNTHYNKSRTHVPVEGYKIEGLRTTPLEKLLEIATELGIENPNELKRQDLMFEILKSQVNQGGFILFTGILEIASEGYGFLRATDANFSDSANDAYVSSTQVKKFALRTGDIVTGQVRPPKDQERYYALLKIEAINYLPHSESKKRPLFENLTPLYPTEKIRLEYALAVDRGIRPVGFGRFVKRILGIS